MAYDLNFWKYKSNIYFDNQEVYKRCSEEEIVEGLEELPIDSIRKEIENEFSEWKIDNDSWQNPSGKGAFQISNTTQFVRFDCYNMTGDDMNRIIEVLLQFDCPLYDPQTSTRYDQP
ncbi:hypothetical protein [Flavobacterium sp. FlaQc-48]|uniref:hypothetical protein n=1 Tax=Flavobacterium sp. FlaQc-48 TaxID=3374181 RepID=UPI003756D0D0